MKKDEHFYFITGITSRPEDAPLNPIAIVSEERRQVDFFTQSLSLTQAHDLCRSIIRFLETISTWKIDS